MSPITDTLLYKRLFVTEEQLLERIDELADAIVDRYQGQNPLFVCLLKGGAPFAAMLMFAIARQNPEFQPQLDYMTVRTYGQGRQAGKPYIINDLDNVNLRGRVVVIVDDVLDTGDTLEFITKHFRQQGAKSIDTTVLIQKRKPRTTIAEATFFGFETTDEWLTGMGMDDTRLAKEGNRWLPGIAIAND